MLHNLLIRTSIIAFKMSSTEQAQKYTKEKFNYEISRPTLAVFLSTNTKIAHTLNFFGRCIKSVKSVTEHCRLNKVLTCLNCLMDASCKLTTSWKLIRIESAHQSKSDGKLLQGFVHVVFQLGTASLCLLAAALGCTPVEHMHEEELYLIEMICLLMSVSNNSIWKGDASCLKDHPSCNTHGLS